MPLLSPNYSLQELTRTHQLDAAGRLLWNTPGPVETANLRFLCWTVLEDMREAIDCPVHVSSGFRSPEVNAAAGSKPTSQHLQGLACDWWPLGTISLEECARRIVASRIPFHQLLLEGRGERRWLHISAPPIYVEPKREALVTLDGVAFTPFNAGPTESQA